jgi:hypothetical protein
MLLQQLEPKLPRSRSLRSLEIRTGIFARTFFVAFVLAAGSMFLQAQNTAATVLGTVKDPSGLGVAGAKVELVNEGTNAKRTVTTDSGGDFREFSVSVRNGGGSD